MARIYRTKEKTPELTDMGTTTLEEFLKPKGLKEKRGRKKSSEKKYPHFSCYRKDSGWTTRYAVLYVELADYADYWGYYTVEYVAKTEEVAKEYAEFACDRDQKQESFTHGYMEYDDDGFETYKPYRYEWVHDEYLPTEQDRTHCIGEDYGKYIIREVKIWATHHHAGRIAEKKGQK